jgi:hypothetical protein
MLRTVYVPVNQSIRFHKQFYLTSGEILLFIFLFYFLLATILAYFSFLCLLSDIARSGGIYTVT